MKKILICLIFLFTANFVFSQHFDMILTGDPILEDIRLLSLETGKPFLSFTPPLSPGEIKYFINSINEDSLSYSGHAAFVRILNRLDQKANISFSIDHFSAFFNIESSLEARFKSNENISEYPQDPNIRPFVAVPIRFFFSNIIQLYVEPSYTKRPNEYKLDVFDFNIPADYFEYDETMPLRSFLSAGGNWWNFQIGRDRLFYGTGHTGSLMFSDNVQYSDFARFSLFSSKFKYSFLINQLPMKISKDLFEPDVDYLTWLQDKENLPFTQTTQRYFYLHRLDFTLFNRVNISLMEGIMVGNSALELRYFNPLIIFHSYFAWLDYERWRAPYDLWPDGSQKLGDMVGSLFSLEVNWNIVKNISFYGQFRLNEFAEKGELERNPDQPPNSLGYLAGLQYSHFIKSWASLYYFEFVYTDPYFGILSSPFGSFIQRNHYGQYYPIGYQRDTISLTLGANFYNNDLLKLSGNFSWIVSGEHNKNGLTWNRVRAPWAFEQTTPSGETAENKFVFSIGSRWTPYYWLGLDGSITAIYAVNNKHTPGSNVFGIQTQAAIILRY